MTQSANNSSSKSYIHRKTRYVSHGLVEIHKFRWLPFYVYSAVLLDLSLEGFKLEFTGEAHCKVGQTLWLNIRLGTFGILDEDRLYCKIKCLWFDEIRYRLGGVFIDLNAAQKKILDHLLEKLEIEEKISQQENEL